MRPQIVYKSALFIGHFFVTLSVMGQQQAPPPPQPDRTPFPGLPIDQHLWILVIAGLIIGALVISYHLKRNLKA